MSVDWWIREAESEDVFFKDEDLKHPPRLDIASTCTGGWVLYAIGANRHSVIMNQALYSSAKLVHSSEKAT